MGKNVLAENKTGIQLVEFINCNNEDMLINYNITSAFAFIKCDNKFLLGKNNWREQWEFPAGKINKNETPREAAIRELYEETHQKVNNLRCVGIFKIFDIKKKEYRYRSVFYGELSRITPFIHFEEDEMEEVLL